MYIGGSDTLPQPLTRQQEADLLRRLDGGELAVRQTLIERNLRLVAVSYTHLTLPTNSRV